MMFSNNTQQINSNTSSNYIHHPQYDNQNLSQKPINIGIQDEHEHNLLKQDLWNQLVRSNYLMELKNIFEEQKIFEQQLVDKNQLANLLYQVLNDSISNIIIPVIERAVNISLVTTKELVIKDFQYESSEQNFKMASTNFIKSLAGALASVTCKEPLRMSFTKKMKDFLMERKIDAKTQENISKMKYTNDFLNVGCNYIFNFVQKKAAENVLQDETILKEIERRKVIDANGNKVFSYDTNTPLMKIVNKLPSILRPNTQGLTKSQLLLYSNFPISIGASPNSDLSKIHIPIVRDILRIIKEVLDNNISPKAYDICMLNVKTIITNNTQLGNEFDEGSEELKLCEKAIIDNKIKEMNLSEQEEKKNITLVVGTTLKYAFLAYESNNKKLLNIFTALLNGWAQVNIINVRKEITDKVLAINNNNPMCFNIGFQIYLINLKLIDLNEYQSLIILFLENKSTRPVFIKLITDLKKCRINDPSIPTSLKLPKLYDFYYNEEKCKKYFAFFGKGCKLPNDLNIITEQIINYKICNIKDQKTYGIFINMCSFAFSKITNTKYPFIKLEPNHLSTNLSNFIQSPFINNEEQLTVFSMIITELCVKRISNSNTTDNYPDSEARCIYTLLMAIPDTLNKLKQFSIILHGIFKTFHYDYMKTGLKFNQRPYFKLFYTFISLFSTMPNNAKVFNSENTKIQYMVLIAQYLKYFSPQNYPGFALAYLELISSENFISCFLGDANSQNVPTNDKNDKANEYLTLLSEIFVFLKICCNKPANKVFMNYVYKFIYLLCNTYPDFINEHYYIIIISLPHENIYMQLKNLLLSATPKKLEQYKNINLEDKDLENEIKENNLEDIYLKKLLDILEKNNILTYIDKCIDKYIENPNYEIVKNICDNLNNNNNITFNFYVIQGLVIYYSLKGLPVLKNINDAYNLFFEMIKLMAMENKTILINSMLNQLRFPSKQTLYFVLIIIYILSNIENEETEEMIISLLFERLLVKPIPWGIELLFKKILNNEKYNLMKTNFFKNINGGDWFINSLQQFLEDKKFVKFSNFKDNKIDMMLSKDKKKSKNEKNKDNDE